jgi:hypothetical protein
LSCGGTPLPLSCSSCVWCARSSRLCEIVIVVTPLLAHLVTHTRMQGEGSGSMGSDERLAWGGAQPHAGGGVRTTHRAKSLAPNAGPALTYSLLLTTYQYYLLLTRRRASPRKRARGWRTPHRAQRGLAAAGRGALQRGAAARRPRAPRSRPRRAARPAWRRGERGRPTRGPRACARRRPRRRRRRPRKAGRGRGGARRARLGAACTLAAARRVHAARPEARRRRPLPPATRPTAHGAGRSCPRRLAPWRG